MSTATQLQSLLTSYLDAPLPVRLSTWDGSEAGPAGAPLIEIHSVDALRRMLWRPGELGIAQAYVTGEIDISSKGGWTLETALEHTLGATRRPTHPRLTPPQLWRALATAARLGAIGRPPSAPPTQARVGGRLHSRARDRSAISHHYNLSNEFYSLILDDTMAYSCGYHQKSDTPVAEAQQAKLDLICNKLRLAEGSTLLDVGCGWGSLTLHAAENYGARVIGVTIAAEQKRFIDARIAERGLSDRVEIRLQDYREVPERDHFDAVASIEMGEHVGRRNYPLYAKTLRDAVRPGGHVLVQQMSRTGRHPGGGPFIETFIAPDMYMRPVGETIRLLTDCGLELRDVQALREHYVWTVAGWLERFEQNAERLTELVGPEAIRVWRLYLIGGSLAFRDGRMGVDQLLLRRSAST